MAHFEDPPPKAGAEMRAAVDLADTDPGRWVFVREYSTQQVANTMAWNFKKAHGKGRIETRTNGPRLFLRAIPMETKG